MDEVRMMALLQLFILFYQFGTEDDMRRLFYDVCDFVADYEIERRIRK